MCGMGGRWTVRRRTSLQQKTKRAWGREKAGESRDRLWPVVVVAAVVVEEETIERVPVPLRVRACVPSQQQSRGRHREATGPAQGGLVGLAVACALEAGRRCPPACCVDS